MKKLTLSLLAACAVASPAFAGTTLVTKEYKPVVVPPSCFADQELQLDLFYSYNDGRPAMHQYYRDGSGGGGAINYFFARYFGFSVEGNWWNGVNSHHRDDNDRNRNRNRDDDNKRSVAHQVSGHFILRYPIETCNLCFAPYIFGGGGGLFNGQRVGFGDVGAGIEFRVTQHIGLFTDWRWNFTGSGKNDIDTTRAGVRFVF